MIFLPNDDKHLMFQLEKLDTYIILNKIGCPVFKSVVIKSDEEINLDDIEQLKQYFKTDEATVRYQYIKPCKNPIQGGNRYKLELENLRKLQNEETYLWILEPINRLKNDYGINLFFRNNSCKIEMVGKGFDVSDLNRGQIAPHQKISTELPLRMGLYNEWWKFLKIDFCSLEQYKLSTKIRVDKLSKMGYAIDYNIFNNKYFPLPYEKLEELLKYITILYASIKSDDYTVSCSISNNKFLFWDIQTPKGKKLAYGVK